VLHRDPQFVAILTWILHLFFSTIKEFAIMFRTIPSKPILAGIGLLGSLALGPPAVAATTATTFAVTATVQAACLISAAPLAFGVYTGVVANASSAVTVTCTNTTPYAVGLDSGTFAGATVTTRRMTGTGGAALAYALFSDAAHATNWGNSIAAGAVAGVGNGIAQALPVFGQVPAGQFVAPGAYTDTITATIVF
jgi:spore coat protein U-like protein